MTISVFIPGDPKGQPRPKAFAFRGHARVYDPGTAEGWKAAIALALRPWVGRTMLAGPVWVSLDFRFRRAASDYRKTGELTKGARRHHVGKPDVDNCAKAVLDACTTLGLWHDDGQVVALHVTKRYAAREERAGLQLVVQEVQADARDGRACGAGRPVRCERAAGRDGACGDVRQGAAVVNGGASKEGPPSW